MMFNKQEMKDLELLSAYLDNQLSPEAEGRLKIRLAKDEELQQALEDLRNTRYVLRNTPKVKRPRNFVLSLEMVKQQRFAWGMRSISRFVSAGAMLILVMVFAGQLFFSGTLGPVTVYRMDELSYKRAPIFNGGFGGGGGGDSTSNTAADVAEADQPNAATEAEEPMAMMQAADMPEEEMDAINEESVSGTTTDDAVTEESVMEDTATEDTTAEYSDAEETTAEEPQDGMGAAEATPTVPPEEVVEIPPAPSAGSLEPTMDNRMGETEKYPGDAGDMEGMDTGSGAGPFDGMGGEETIVEDDAAMTTAAVEEPTQSWPVVWIVELGLIALVVAGGFLYWYAGRKII